MKQIVLNVIFILALVVFGGLLHIQTKINKALIERDNEKMEMLEAINTDFIKLTGCSMESAVAQSFMLQNLNKRLMVLEKQANLYKIELLGMKNVQASNCNAPSISRR